MLQKYIILWTIVLGCLSYAQGQDITSRRQVIINTAQTSFHVSESFIIPESVSIVDLPALQEISADLFTVNQDTILFNWTDQVTDSVLLTYRILPRRLGLTLSHFDTTKIRYGINQDYIGFDIGPESVVGTIDVEGLDYDGSFLRGLSFGNNQSLFLNSAFNLQIAGKIGDDTEILAALTDENIPLQPQGNTQQLNEFDKIFIQIKNKNKTLTAGDFELKNNPSHFLRYFKKLKGGSFSIDNKLNEKYEISSKVSAAISRGKFARYPIETQEGNQGPYRLIGSNGERFIIVLAGSERIYYDGQLLKRGIEEDYIIDYNQAEVRFTNKRLITKDSRIIIEFEYTFEIYNRGFYAIQSEIKSKKLNLGLQLYNEQDSNTPTTQFTFSEEQLNTLRSAGDDPGSTVSSSIRPLNPENSLNPVTYILQDTLFNNQTQQILIYSTTQNATLYTATFRDVGINNGHYIRADPQTNGQVFEWIQPNPDGSPNGNFAPITNLVAPTKKQVIALNAEYKINKNNTIATDFSISNNDLNKLSENDDDNNTDIAGFIKYIKSIPLSKTWSSEISAIYEVIGKDYNAVNPFRNQEFTRDWNTNNISNIKAKDQTSRINISVSNGQKTELKYAFNIYNRRKLYKGNNHIAQLTQNWETIKINSKINYLTSNSDLENTTFLRPSLSISKTFKKINGLKIEYKNNFEKNEIIENSIISNRSFQFYEQTASVGMFREKGLNWNISHKYRQDHLTQTEALKKANSANEIQLSSSIKTKNSTYKFSGHYRNLSIDKDIIDSIDPQETYLGKLEHNWKTLNGGLLMTNNYELGSGQEERIDVVFVETIEEGQGQYIHKELTGDNIKQNFEFFLAPFDNQGNYARVTLGSTDFIRTHNVRFNQSLKINFRKILTNSKNKLSFVKRISINSNLLSTKTNEATSSKIVWNPFNRDLLEGVIIAAENRWRTSFFFNRGDPLYQIQYAYTQRQNKNLFTTGFESRELYTHAIESRVNLNKQLTAELSLKKDRRKSDNEIFSDRNFNISTNRIEPKLTYLASRKLRVRSTAAYETSKNSPDDEKAESIEFAMNFQLRQSTKSSIQAEVTYSRIKVNEDISPSLELDFLQGLTPGNNLIWNLSIDRTIAKNLRLSMIYDGRKLGEGKMVHTGSAQIGATF